MGNLSEEVPGLDRWGFASIDFTGSELMDWFRNRRQLLAGLTKFGNTVLEDEKDARVNFKKLLEAHKKDTSLEFTNKLCESLSTCTVDCDGFKILWIGKFNELLTSQKEYARSIRERFREGLEDEENNIEGSQGEKTQLEKSIKPSEMDGFVEFIASGPFP